jgi:hypothetical protein
MGRSLQSGFRLIAFRLSCCEHAGQFQSKIHGGAGVVRSDHLVVSQDGAICRLRAYPLSGIERAARQTD